MRYGLVAILLAAAATIPSRQFFTANGTGAVQRGLASKLGDVVSVMDFGAVGDGVTDDTAAVQSAITYIMSNGGTLLFPSDTLVASAVTATLVSGKPAALDLGGHKLILAHTSGVGLTVNGGTLRQPFSIRNGTIAYSGSTAGTTGVKLASLTGASMRDILFTGFTSASQTVMLLDFCEDDTFDQVQWVGNNGAGEISLDITNFSNANRYSAIVFQSNTQAIRVRGGTSDNWFSDCLIQSSVGTNGVTVEVTGTDGNISGTHFDRCHFENNGDGTANASAIFFNTDAGKAIVNTSMTHSFVSGGTNGALGVALRGSATGGPLSSIASVANYYTGVASVLGGTVPNGANLISVNDKDDSATLTAQVQLGTGGTASVGGGVILAPQGGTKKFQMFAGYTGQQDANWVFRDLSGATDLLLYNSSTWKFQKGVSLIAGATLTIGRGVLAYSASITPNLQTCQVCTITATTGTAFTINNPSNPLTNARLTLWLINTSGGALGAITLGGGFKTAGAIAAPATANRRGYEFEYDGALWYETWRSAADVPN